MALQDQRLFNCTHSAARHSGCRAFVVALICSLLLDTAGAAEQELIRPVSFTGFKRLALAISDAPPPVRADFAIAALSEMVLAHTQAADQARHETRDNRAGQSAIRWAIAVDLYTAQLSTILDGVTADTPISIDIGPEDDVYLNIDGNPVMVSFPKTLQQTSFEQAVIDRFCSLYLCEELMAEYRALKPSLQAVTSTPHWSFSEKTGPVCATDDGLEFHFQDTLRLAEKREACGRVVAELNALALVMAENRAGGIHIAWERLTINTIPGEQQHEVDLDGEGNRIRLYLPALAATAKLFELVRPWLAARVEGSPIRQAVTNADSLMAPLLNRVQ